MGCADLAVECERLASDFGRLALADVSGEIVTERELKWCRRPIPRMTDYDRLGARITAKPRDRVIFGWADGCELSDVIPETVEEWLSAPVWYGPINCEPSLNYFGQSMVMESGWSTLHEWELSGANASHAFDLLERAGQWTQKRWGWLSRLLWPGRESVAGKRCWPDVVNQVSELAQDATLPRPEWSVIVGEYRAWWPVAMWKRRDRLPLSGHHCTPEDIERIGEDPEVVLASRKHWLKDSETALDWLANKFRNYEQPVAPVVVPADSLLSFTNEELMSELAKIIKTNKEKHWKAHELRLKILGCNPGRTTSVKSIEKNPVYQTLLETQGRKRKRKIDPDVLWDVVSQSQREHAAENNVRIKGRRIKSRD